jgi:hypothetical protein
MTSDPDSEAKVRFSLRLVQPASCQGVEHILEGGGRGSCLACSDNLRGGAR